MIKADLTGRAVLVTGGISGIGLAAVELFARNGARVAVNHLPGDARADGVLERLCADGLDVLAAPGDVADAEDAGRMVTAAAAALGRLDVLISNAGTAGTVEPIPFDALERMTESFWSTILATNLLGPFRCARAAVSHLEKTDGCIVNTASIAAFGGTASSLAYAASKAGLVNLTRNLARALAPKVRVNAVAPGLTRTPWTDPWPEERKRSSIANTWLQRLVEPEDVAGAMLFLASSPAITGQTLVVDGGRSY